MTPGSVEADILQIFDVVFQMVGPLIGLAVMLSFGFMMINLFFRSIVGPSSLGSSSSTDPRPYQLRKFDALAADITKLVPKTDPVRDRLPEWRKSIEKLSHLGTEQAEETLVGLLNDLQQCLDQLLLAQTYNEIAKAKNTTADIKEQVLRLNDKLEALIEIKLSDQEALLQ